MVLALAFVTFVAPSPATADRLRLSDIRPDGQIVLARGEVIYQSTLADWSIETRATGLGGDTRVLHRTDVPRPRMRAQAQFDASPTHLAVSSALYLPCYCRSETATWDPDRLEAGPSDNPRQTPARFCSTTHGPVAVAVDGSRVAFVADCDRSVSGDERVIVDDLATGATLADVPAVHSPTVRLAGRYLAWVEYDAPTGTPAVVVYDYEARAPSYRLTHADFAFDLQDDGKVVVARTQPATSESCYRLAWASPSEPFLHDIAEPACARTAVRIAGDRIASIGRHDGRTSFYVADLAGNPREIATPAGKFDFDGERLAYTQRSCSGRQDLFVDDLRGPGQVEPGDCPMRVQRGPFRIGRDRTFRIRVGCERGCLGSVTVRGQASGGRYSFERAVRATLETGENRRIAVRLPARARRLLARRRSLRFTVDTETLNRDEGQAHVTLRRTLLARRGR
jgi:hypothetical protein